MNNQALNSDHSAGSSAEEGLRNKLLVKVNEGGDLLSVSLSQNKR
jgi:hypothetical protein